jgi:mitochondrial fission protein ELM1
VLKNNEAIAMTIDQGGVSGMHVKFFGKDASMATGAMRLGLKYGSALLPVFFSRTRGPKAKITIRPALNIKATGDLTTDLQFNLQEAMKIFEDFISSKPEEYLWTYKIWKHGYERDILVLWDGRTGHLRQAQTAASELAEVLKERNIRCRINTFELQPGKKEDYPELLKMKPDFVISCGSSVSRLNLFLSKENNAKSVVIMRPRLLNTSKFDLVIMPRHDNPPERPNIAVTDGALNLVSQDYLRAQADKLNLKPGKFIGLLLGGDSKRFRLAKNNVREVCSQLKKAAQESGAGILVSTSRRTSLEIEKLIKAEFKDFPACRLLVIANEMNIPEAVGGILGLSSVTVVSPESISMVSEAASSGRKVVVFNEKGLSGKHRRFLDYLSKNNYIDFSDSRELAHRISLAQADQSQARKLNDREKIRKALGKII